MTAPALVRVIGVGNPLRGDDGIGVALVERLAAEGLPPGVEAVDAGTGGLTLLDLLAGASRLVLVDAAELGLPPGTVVRVDGPDLDLGENLLPSSLHGAGVGDALALGRELGLLPPTVLFLVQVARVEVGQSLSAPLAEVLGDLAARVRAEVLLPLG